jgi:hypothetical protein
MSFSVLATRSKVKFDPANEDHLKEYAIFLEQGRWQGTCRFQLEFPYIEIPAMINAKIAAYVTAKYFSSSNEKNVVTKIRA